MKQIACNVAAAVRTLRGLVTCRLSSSFYAAGLGVVADTFQVTSGR
jgi:hypothetical protein